MGLQATAIRDILLNASSYGVAYDELCVLAGFTPEEIADSSQTVEWEKAAKLWELLADLTGTEQIGLHLGLAANISMTGMVGFLMQVSKNISEALDVYCRFGTIVCPMIVFERHRQGDMIIVELHQNAMWKGSYPRSARIAVDFVLTSMVAFFKSLTGKELYPQAVELEFPKAAVSEYRDLLRCQMLFNAPLHRVILQETDLETPVLTSDQSMYTMFSNILSQKKSLMLQANCTDALKNLLLMQFKGQIPTIEEAAEMLQMTVRTLQRKLTEEGTSFRNIANEVKKELALHLMKNPRATVTEVAGIMGYGDLPAFRRAFKSWTQATPKEVKRKIKAELQVA